MKKDINLKDINFKNLKDSPIFFAFFIGVFILMVLALCIYLIMDIFSLKKEIVSVKAQYVSNCNQIVELQHIQAKYNELIIEKDAIDRMLPVVGDPEEYSYAMMQDLYENAALHHLTVSKIEKPLVSSSYTTEIAAVLTVTGTYSNITAFVEYYSGLEAIHRIEKIDLTDTEGTGVKQAVISIVALTR